MTPTLLEDRQPEAAILPSADPILVPALSPSFALTKWHVAITATLGGLFVLINHLPLRGTDLWCHVIYGRWMLEHGQLPTTDPVMPLAEGVSVINAAWLSQTLFAVVQSFGDIWLSNLFAILILATYAVLSRVFTLRSGSLALGLMGMLSALAIGWSRLTTIRPEIFGTLLFSLLLWTVTRIEAGRHSRRDWLAIFCIMLAWANAHGSFPVGLLLLASLAIGRAIEASWQARTPIAALADRETRRWFWLAELGAVATLVNPYGIELWLEVARFGANENLRDLVEWFPMAFWGVGGFEFLFAWVALTLLLRHSRRPLPVGHALLLVVFGLAAANRVRMMTWLAPTFVWVAIPHLADIVSRLRNRQPASVRGATANVAISSSLTNVFDDRTSRNKQPVAADDTPLSLPHGRRWSYSLVCLVICWIAFSLSDLSRPLLHGRPRAPERLYGPQTPLATTEYLAEHAPSGLVFVPQPWADWLVTHGPSGWHPMVTSNVHLAPRKVWQDYQHIAQAQPGWQAVADRYLISTIIVDKEQQTILTPVLRRSPDWRVAHEDDASVVFQKAPRAG